MKESSDFRFQIADCQLPIADCRLLIADLGIRRLLIIRKSVSDFDESTIRASPI